MSFCSTVKNEIAAIRPSGCCKPSLVYGFMLFGRSFSLKRISMQTNNENMVNTYAELVKRVYGIDVKISCGGSTRPTYKAEVESASERLMILASVDYGINESFIDNSLFSRECCSSSFIRGAFLACGNINDPEKEYRAEFSIRNENLADELLQLLSNHGLSFIKGKRGNNTVLYTKDSTIIEDFLTLIGATNQTLDLMSTKIMKSVKNNINRARNCDNANISKTVEASIKQRTAIEYLEKSGRLSSLSKELFDAAMLRKNNPNATLTELCRLSDKSVTVSGLNHRLSKIMSIYDEIKNK